MGVIQAFKIARRQAPATLVLLGNFASDDPEGARIYESLLACREERILILPNGDDTALVNTIQRRAAVILSVLQMGLLQAQREPRWQCCRRRDCSGSRFAGIRPFCTSN